ncbi:MAG: helix-turn-helix transcriptional regulator [Bifidobacteriaceae bacterium]|jgi:transcriptional regulator with XRE-family HTH domain|nr:helix-turn-helix transcriptional regulator [Bifidobacteriaceae bacterium]
MAIDFATTAEIAQDLGRQIRSLRLERNLDQAGLAEQANISVGAVKALEAGTGSSLATLIRVARALGRREWLRELRPIPEVGPMAMLRAQQGQRPRQRASRRAQEST